MCAVLFWPFLSASGVQLPESEEAWHRPAYGLLTCVL